MASLIRHRHLVALVAATAVARSVIVEARTFVDDLGVSHNIEGSPTIVVRAGIGAVSLSHFGLAKEQIVGVYGNWFVRGSNLDLDNADTGSSYFPDADPSEADVAMLKEAVNLSPNCFNDPSGCNEINSDDLQTLDPDYFIYIDNGVAAKGLDLSTFDTVGITPIFIDTVYESGCRDADYSDSKESCLGRSSIDIAQRIEELAVALGATIPESVQQDKQALCEAAANFAEHMEEAQSKGIRVLAPLFTFSTEVTVRTFDPTSLWILRTFEELGMPLLHSTGNKEYPQDDWFTSCPTGAVAASCNSQSALPADVWLFDTRAFPTTSTFEFSESFPDRAIVANQFSHWARNDGAISYQSVARVLDRVGTAVSQASRLHARTACTNADPTSASFTAVNNGGGLQLGEYACFNPDHLKSDYLTCPDGSNSFVAASRSNCNSKTVSFLGVVSVFVGALGVFL